ncbi:helix-turn-helix transcriptional regulator [Kouleothrix sp.]|uniref:helix-turn-helix transcriptional regulator n=1 Tax=Kouleothrix sp. TaxID=2779161 RepID=UPI00391B6324
MYHPTTRVLTVLELLQSHGRMSGPDLAARLEVNVRTIRHYIAMLQDLGIPIEAERGRAGAYRMRPGFKLPPLMFTEDEAVALTLGLLAARRLGLAAAAPATEGALAKVERVLPEGTRARVQALQHALRLEFPMLYNAPDSAVVVTFSTAVQQRRRVEFGYRSWRGEDTERAIDPYGVVYYGGRWYAAGFCQLRRGLRAFRLDRVRRARLLDATFTPPSDFDSLAFVVHSLATTPGDWAIEVLLQTDLETARGRVPETLATLEPTAEGVVLRCNVQNLDWFAHFLAGLHFPLVVRQPSELRAELRALAERVAALAAAEEPAELAANA